MALTMQGRVYAISERRLGTGFETNEDTFVLVEGIQAYRIVAVDAEECHSCALSVNEDVYTWGVGIFKALGYKNREKCRQPTLVKGPWNGKIGHVAIVVTLIPCEGFSTLVATSNGLLYGWGDAATGQLGSDVLTVQDLVVHQMSIPTKEMLRVTCAAYTSVVSTTEGHAFMWGSSAAGEGALLNRDDAVNRNVD
ncbi:hypothetical protein CCR75_009707 [Bremia lactucae]|uniref:Uncharacterized protein n=1 Tax=Bremia lactucae TaxID=4779 RepID=A0A976FNF2_BRELC|nr:hypothetical protein CCR75_009707 [Bremia lactucae]